MLQTLAQQVQIGGNGNGPSYTLEGPQGFNFSSASIGEIIGKSLGYVFAAAGVGLLLMIIASGFTMMTSAGDAKKLAKGQQTLTNAVIGFLVVFAAFWIVQIMGTILGWQGIINIFGQ